MLEEKKTSQEWQKLVKEVVVLDSDGWDRSNYKYSWEQEQITIQEFFSRVAESTCIYPKGFDIIRQKYLSKIY